MLRLKKLLDVLRMRMALGTPMNEGSCFGVTDLRELRPETLERFEDETWREWCELGLREEKGSALGAALQSFESALQLSPQNADLENARLRVVRHFTHISEYKLLVESSGAAIERSEHEEIMSGRKLSKAEFGYWCTLSSVVDAKIETFGDGYGEPYNPCRLIYGTLHGEPIWTES